MRAARRWGRGRTAMGWFLDHRGAAGGGDRGQRRHPRCGVFSGGASSSTSTIRSKALLLDRSLLLSLFYSIPLFYSLDIVIGVAVLRLNLSNSGIK